MRIIAGKHRGRRLIGPADQTTTRPVTDRAKQSIFDRLAVDGALKDAVVLDLFCGTGSMGIECLSRGARHVTFVDRDRDAARRLAKNLEALGEAGSAVIRGGDALAPALVDTLPRRDVSLIFFDPPFAAFDDPRTVERIVRQIDRLAAAAAPRAAIILRTDRRTEPPASLERWTLRDTRVYGTMAVHELTKIE